MDMMIKRESDGPDMLSNEADRLVALHASGILDTAPDPRFDNITALARDMFDVPVALITLIDEHRQWFKSNCGLDGVSETAREVAFCDHAIRQTGIFVVENALEDVRFVDNPLVTEEPGVRFYAGAPIITKEGHAFGTLCLIDTEPRVFSGRERMRLASLAETVTGAMENHQMARQLASNMAELKVSSEINQAVLDASRAGIIGFKAIRDGQGDISDFSILTSNKANEVITGIPMTRLIERTFLENFPGAKTAGLFEAYCKVVETGEPVELDLFYDHEGLNDWFEVSATPMGADGLTATFSSITRRKTFERALRRINSLGSMVATDPELFLREMLEIGCTAFGLSHGFVSHVKGNSYTIRQLVGDFPDFKAGDSVPLSQTIAELVIKSSKKVVLENVDDVFRSAHPDAAMTPFRCYMGAPIFVDGELYGAVSFAGYEPRENMDIPWKGEILWLIATNIAHAVALSEAFNKLRRTRDELRLVLDNVPARIWYRDETSRILRANKSALTSVGMCEPSDVEGRTTEELFPEMAAKYIQDDLDVIESGEARRGIIESYEPVKGQPGWISTDKIPLYDEDGNRYVLAVSTDITEIKRTEEQLLRLNESLSDFAFVAAHDLQAPLRQSALFAGLLRDELDRPDTHPSAEADEYLQEVVSGIARMRELVRNLYDLFKLDGEKIGKQTEDLNELAVIASSQMNTEIAMRGADVQIGSLPSHVVNSSLIIQMFQNLIGNACKYADVENLTVRIYSHRDVRARKLLVFVEDNGIGVPVDMAEKIFEPFKRLHHKHEVSGAGIGLSLCRKIATLHDADLYLDTEYSNGARFVVAFNF